MVLPYRGFFLTVLLSSDFVSVMLAIFTTFLQFSVIQQLYPQLLHQRHLAVLKEAKVYIN